MGVASVKLNALIRKRNRIDEALELLKLYPNSATITEDLQRDRKRYQDAIDSLVDEELGRLV